MNELKIFENSEFGKVRVQEINNEAYFIGKEIADMLGYQNGSRDIDRHVEDEDKLSQTIFNAGQNREMILINESGLYSLILSSKLPNAKKFKKWVTSEVLPTIRKTGGYVNNEDMFINTYLPNIDDNTRIIFKGILESTRKLNDKIEQDKPKVLFAESVEVSKDCILIGELAKLLRQKGIDIGQNRLFEKLRDLGYLGNKGEYRNIPTQKAADLEIFKIVKRELLHSDGTPRIVTTTFVTGKRTSIFYK